VSVAASLILAHYKSTILMEAVLKRSSDIQPMCTNGTWKGTAKVSNCYAQIVTGSKNTKTRNLPSKSVIGVIVMSDVGKERKSGRKADEKSKTFQIIMKPRPEWEREVRAFKEIHKRNNFSISETIMEKAVRVFLREHHWPETPGHSQFQITEFTGDAQKKLVCERCGAEGVSRLYEAVFISGKQLKECEECFKRAKEHRLVKKFLKVITATYRRC
jgi:hypothetical protein